MTSRRAIFGATLALLVFLVTFAVIRQPATSAPPADPVDEAPAPEPPADSASETASGAVSPDTGSEPSELPDGLPVVQMPPDESPAGLLVAAAGAGDAGRVRELLAAGAAADAESQGTFAMHRAAAAGSVAALQILVEAGAHLEALNQYGQTALTHSSCPLVRVMVLRTVVMAVTSRS